MTLTRIAAIAGCLLPALTAHASMTVTPALAVTNACNTDIAIAVHYKANTGWTTTSFVTIPANRTRERVASSGNSIFYYYAESTSSRYRWSGDSDFRVEGKAYPMKKTKLERDDDRNRYHLRLSCRNA